MIKMSCKKFRSRKTGRLRRVHLNVRLSPKIKLGCTVFLERPFGLIIRDEERLMCVPFGVWTHRRGRFSIFGLNLLFLGFHVLIDHEAKR